MITKETLRYFKNDDTSTIGYKNFAFSPTDTYPSFSICFTDDKTERYMDGLLYYYFNDEISATLPIPNADHHKFHRILTGYEIFYQASDKVNFDIRNMSEAYFNTFSIQLERLYDQIIFETENQNTTRLFDFKKNLDLPFYVSYQDPDNLCFTRKDDAKENTNRVADELKLYRDQLEKFHSYINFKIYIHHPAQLLRVFNAPVFVSWIGRFEWEKTDYEIKISQVSIMRKRPDSNIPCDPDLHNDDMQFMIKVSEEVGCIPIYWKKIMFEKLNMSICNRPEDMKLVWNKLKNFASIHSTYHQPCNEMKLVAIVDQRPGDGFYLKTRFLYVDKNYQEIVNERDFGLESLWSTVGGFLGIFIGASLSQIPIFIARACTWIRNSNI